MIVLLSPAKRMDETEIDSSLLTPKATQPIFTAKTKDLVYELKKYDPIDLIEMMRISPKIADLNVSRYQQFEKLKSKVAIFLFQGDSYRSFNPKTLSQKSLKYAKNHLFILSGLYGLIRPFDLIKPYRLEMGTKLQLKNGKKINLPKYWKFAVNNKLNDLNKNNEPIINLASNEYSQVIEEKVNKINIIFKQNRHGVDKTFGILAKKARGLMARYIIENQITHCEDLKLFNQDGYQFQKEKSAPHNFVFIQN